MEFTIKGRTFTEADMEQISAAATPWDQIRRLARAADTPAESNELALRLLDERPYLGLAGAYMALAIATGCESPL